MAIEVFVVAPRPTLLAGTNGVVKSAPAPTLVFGVHSIAGTAPAPTANIQLDNPGRLYTFAGTAPAPTATLVLTETGWMHAGVAGIAPAPDLTASITAGEVSTFAGQAPSPTLSALLTNPVVIAFSGTAPAPRATISGFTGMVATFAGEAPAPTLVSTGYPAYTLGLVITAPAPQMSASLTAAITAAFRTWVMNTRTGGLTEYGSVFAFNSYAVFNGQVLAAGATGVVVLGTQALDGTAEITARVRTGKESFGSSLLKRVPRIYTSGEYPGDMLFRTITTESGTRTYSLPMNGVTGIQQRRVPVGKGPKSRFWQYEIENVAGADFAVNDILVQPVALRRRVQ